MCVTISALIVATTTFSVLTLRGQLILKEAAAETINSTNTPTSSNRSTITPSSHVDSSPIVAVIIITKDNQGNLIFLPNTATIKPGEEILILNNDTKPHTVVNGMGPNDPLSGKLFDTGVIKPMAFIEYGASNLQQGKYPYYLPSEPNVKGEIIVSAAGGK
jgi:plastocyanin